MSELTKQPTLALQSTQTTFIVNTMPFSTLAEAKKVYNVLENAKPMKKLVNKDFYIMHIVQQNDEMVNEKTGVIEPCIITTIVDEKGDAYATNSKPIARSIEKLLAMFASMGVTELKKGDCKATLIAKPTKSGDGDYNSLYIYED